MKRTKHHIRVGDKVKIITGNQKGFIGDGWMLQHARDGLIERNQGQI
jgi:ribosomal protein L24